MTTTPIPEPVDHACRVLTAVLAAGPTSEAPLTGTMACRGLIEVEAESVAYRGEHVRWHLVRRPGVGLLRLPATKTGEKGERIIPVPSWAVEILRRRRALRGPGVEAVLPDSLGGWRDPSNVRRVWRQVRDDAEMRGLVSHTLRKTVASFLDDANVSTRKISDQLGHVRVSMTQDKYLGRKITDRETADVLEGIVPASGANGDPKVSLQEGTTKAAGS